MGENIIKRTSIFARQICHSTWQKEVYEAGQSLMVRAKFHNMYERNKYWKKEEERMREIRQRNMENVKRRMEKWEQRRGKN